MSYYSDNLALMTDSYKVTHWKQYPPGAQFVYSYFESRGGDFNETVFFGLQYIIKKYLLKPITKTDVEEAQQFWKAHFGQDLFNVEDWNYIVDHHKGMLPLEIKAVKEGTVVNKGNVLMTIVNTDKRLPWLTNWFETILMQVWYPSIVATQSRYMKKTILNYLERTGDPNSIDFKLHDFGFRGSTSLESAGIGGCAHLVNFLGTDTAAALVTAKNYYNCDMAGFSIPAAEHSTITAWGRSREAEAYKNMLEQYPTGLVAVVSDSYDIFKACSDIWGNLLKENVLSRDGTLVIRPDSGEPAEIIPTLLQTLGQTFGYETNKRGYKVLNPKVRLIQGDGIDRNSIAYILSAMKDKFWSADNIVFGSGGALLQKVNRDTGKFAIKCSAIAINGKWQDVYKDPVTDQGKKSKAGLLALMMGVDDKYVTVKSHDGSSGLLEPVFCNGWLLREQSLEEIRKLAKIG